MAMINADIAFLTWYFLYWCINGPYLFKMNLQHNFIKFHTAFFSDTFCSQKSWADMIHNLFHIQWIIVLSEHWAVVLLVKNMVFKLK